MALPEASRAVSVQELETLLYEDVPFGDLTTEALALGDVHARMELRARSGMVVALAEEASALIRMTGGEPSVAVKSGSGVMAGALIVSATGPAGALLKSWKVAQTLMECWSGVATATRDIVTAARSASPNIVIACTRKNIPGTRRFAAAAVLAGGGTMHRLGLSETILVFPEHLTLLGTEPLNETVARLRRAAPEKKLVIEVTSVVEGVAAAEAGFDVVQTEKFLPDEIARLTAALRDLPRRPVIAAAGGITAANAAEIARAGADVLVTSRRTQRRLAILQ